MKKLIKAVTAEIEARIADFIQEINKVKTLEKLKENHYLKRALYKTQRGTMCDTLKDAKEIAIANFRKSQQKDLESELNQIKLVKDAKPLQSVTISVEWKKSRMWGMNPQAEAKVCYKDGTCEIFLSSRVGGCGYDKHSTAVAEALNQSKSVLQKLYKMKDKNIESVNRELLGYGSGSGVLPRLEGGVGVDCYPRIFEKVGLKMRTTASGKTFDVHTISKR